MIIKRLQNLFIRQFKGEAGDVFRGMLTLVMGAGGARIVGIASIPILTRMYSPDDYGVLAVYTSIVTLLVPILTLRYVTAIPLPKTDVMAFNLFIICAKLIALGGLLIALILGLFGHIVLGWFSMGNLAPYWWLIAIGTMGAATYELFSAWATRKKDYRVIAKTQLSQSLLGELVKISLGLLSIRPLGLVFGQVFSQSAGTGSYLKNARKDFKKLCPLVSKNRQKIIASFYRDFPKYRLPSQFLMVLSMQAPILMMATLYDKGATGQLSLAFMALSFPVSLVGSAMSKAYYAEIAAIGKSDLPKIRRITYSVQKKLFVIGVPITIGAIFFAQPLFVLFFGVKWSLAGKYAAMLSPFMLLQFTSNPLVQVLNIVGSQFLFLAINVVRIIGLCIIWGCTLYVLPNSSQFVFVLSLYLFLFYLIMSWLIFYEMGHIGNVEKNN
ncbi:MAG: oligosaccharide flippase family protein [Thermomonas sp.]|uniref:lipopolysaccharide biosynthesis protein n=1 Tax=Thermomonas sp. TaxID=1971895 RepID=UPI001ECB779E|nr:oligosaccharide flippase family protein [Thermomonas sp.]MBV2209765.1 oligosaccharide flippase family protein [Thermomonas sp.]